MTSPYIPGWRERLKSCFRWRQRFLHVFGIPSALGAAIAVGGSSALGSDLGIALGGFVAGLGVVLYGYYVTAGLDQNLVKQLQQEASKQVQDKSTRELVGILQSAAPEVRLGLEKILYHHRTIEAVFLDGIDDSVEAMMQSSRPDLADLRDRAIQLVKLHGRLERIIQASDGAWLEAELQRIQEEEKRTEPGTVRDALLEAKESTERTLLQWRAAKDKKKQIGSVLTVIEKNLQEFKLAMELRKADVAIGGVASVSDVSELQARLRAAGEACDEIVGNKNSRRNRVSRRTRS